MENVLFDSPSVGQDDIEQIYKLVVETARAGGEEASRARAEGVDVARTKVNHLDVVTAADIRTESLIRRMLLSARPDDAFVGEESEPAPGGSGVTWFVDPIDGTVNYMYGDSAYAVSIAAYAGSVPIAGAIYSPGRNELWSAAHGHGAFLNGEAFTTPVSPSPDQPLFATVFDYDPGVRKNQADRFSDVATSLRDLRALGSTALDLCRVAAGSVDCFFADTVNWWDVAAGVCIANEAGAEAFASWSPDSEKVICLAYNKCVDDSFVERFRLNEWVS